MAEPTYLTSEGLAKLREEAEVFRTTRRQDVAARIQRANSIGGTVDNAEYEEAKKEQAFIEGHILDLDKIINNAKIIDTSVEPSGVVRIGSKVKVLNQAKNKQVVYQILGSPETDPSKGRISNLSPIGRALLGKHAGDIAVKPVMSKLDLITPHCFGLISTKSAQAASLLKASIPSDPVPAKRSSTLASLTLSCPKILKMAPRTKSEVGLAPVIAGGINFLPRTNPPVTRILPDLSIVAVDHHISKQLCSLV